MPTRLPDNSAPGCGSGVHAAHVRNGTDDFADGVIDFGLGCGGGEREADGTMNGMQRDAHG
jgi:hypothetical protein